MTNHRTVRQFAAVMVIMIAYTSSACAVELNEDFNSATILAPGVLSVLDELTASGSSSPDTVLGNRDQFGDIEFVDDDNSPIGNGLGSALYGIPTNSGSIDFAVTGYDDFDFVGQHIESGGYEVFVDVYDIFEELIDSFGSGPQMLEEGFVNEFSYFDSAWIGGTYDVYINNLIGPAADVDFFRFTGLTPGTPFVARTLDPDELEIDTWLGWFNSLGELIAVDDDGAGGFLSLIEGIVPDNGELTFAVTGYGDDEFLGQHSESGMYGLDLELNPHSPLGDFDLDGDVDGVDFLMWQRGESFRPLSPADLANWESRYGTEPESLSGTSTTVPEPGAMALAGVCAIGFKAFRCRRYSSES